MQPGAYLAVEACVQLRMISRAGSRKEKHGVGSAERPVIKSGHYHKSFTSTHYPAIVWSADPSLHSEFNYGRREIDIERFSHSKLGNKQKMVHFNYISVDRYNLIVENQANRWCFFTFSLLSECISISSCVFVCADFPFRQSLRCRFRFTTMCFVFVCVHIQTNRRNAAIKIIGWQPCDWLTTVLFGSEKKWQNFSIFFSSCFVHVADGII